MNRVLEAGALVAHRTTRDRIEALSQHLAPDLQAHDLGAQLADPPFLLRTIP